ncbi:MAG: DUF3429 family protein [Spiribacter sp.]|nr:DUF3429 family protein [Spiribacter sp.]MDR9488967.1 DUF3429 family protein [Spiribacter sp.]
MSEQSDINKLSSAAEVVVFHSPVTDLGGLDAILQASGREWRTVEMGMGSAESREQFGQLKLQTGHNTLPQVFINGRFVGGIEEADSALRAHNTNFNAARWMGYLGLLPFLAGGVAVWFGPTWLAHWLVAYGAVILAFVGAVYWGLAMGQKKNPEEIFYASVLPALLGWVALLVPRLVSLPILMAGFIGWRLWEHRVAGAMIPQWFGRLRSLLTVGAVLGLGLGWAALLPIIGRG